MGPYLTDSAAISGKIKLRAEDFFVEEVPLYEACGEGTHVYFEIEKVDITTADAAAAIAKALSKARSDVGFAGRKDAHAVSRQWMSAEHVEESRVAALELPRIKILRVSRHKNKLKTGHLKANKFRIKLRQTQMPADQAAKVAKEVLTELEKRGVPNYFGKQRFGTREDSHILGGFIARGKVEEFADQFLGRPGEGELPLIAEARRLYDGGDYEEAIKKWPWSFADQRRALKAIIDGAGNKRRAYNVVDKNLKKLLISAFQSELFNRVLAERMEKCGIDTILTGDMAYKHENGAMFAVEDAASEQPRCANWEISPTGPLIGSAMRKLTGQAGEIENPILESAGLDERDMKQLDNFARGGRRVLRFRPVDWDVMSGRDDAGEYVEFAFTLDAGSYATTLLREVCKKEF